MLIMAAWTAQICLSENGQEEAIMLRVSQTTTFDEFSSYERVLYEVQQLVPYCSSVAEYEDQVTDEIFYFEFGSSRTRFKSAKIFSQDYHYKRKISTPGRRLPVGLPLPYPGKPLNCEIGTCNTEETNGGVINGIESSETVTTNAQVTPTDRTPLSSFFQLKGDKKFSYEEWKRLVQNNLKDWKFLESNISSTAHHHHNTIAKVSAKDELARIDGSLSELEARIDAVEIAMESLEQNTRRNWLVLHGVYEKEDEDTLEVLIKIIKEKTGLRMNPQDIENCHRMGRRKFRNKADPIKMQMNKRPIVIKFVNYCKRKDLWDQKKNLRGSGLLLTESLTNKRLELLQKARTIFGEKSVWSQDGRIMFRKEDGSKIRINSVADINVISNQLQL